MDPDQLLENIRCEIQTLEFEDGDAARRLADLFEAMDDWLKKGGFIPKEWVSTKLGQRANGERRMSNAQRNRLWELCGNYNVPFQEDDYGFANASPDSWVEGWVGGKPGTIYVGVSPEGESHS